MKEGERQSALQLMEGSLRAPITSKLRTGQWPFHPRTGSLMLCARAVMQIALHSLASERASEHSFRETQGGWEGRLSAGRAKRAAAKEERERSSQRDSPELDIGLNLAGHLPLLGRDYYTFRHLPRCGTAP